jgi:hypothetical protein
MSYTRHPGHLYLDIHSGRWRITCRDGSTAYYYRAVMEAHLGRELAPTEHVHHINGDTADDRIENLQLLDIAVHGALHSPDGIAARRAKRRFAWSRDYAACTECGTDAAPYYSAGKCRRCYHRTYMRARRAGAAA